MNNKQQNLEKEIKDLLPKLIIAAELIPVMNDLYKRYESLGISDEEIGSKINQMILEERPNLKDIIDEPEY